MGKALTCPAPWFCRSRRRPLTKRCCSARPARCHLKFPPSAVGGPRARDRSVGRDAAARRTRCTEATDGASDAPRRRRRGGRRSGRRLGGRDASAKELLSSVLSEFLLSASVLSPASDLSGRHLASGAFSPRHSSSFLSPRRSFGASSPSPAFVSSPAWVGRRRFPQHRPSRWVLSSISQHRLLALAVSVRLAVAAGFPFPRRP